MESMNLDLLASTLPTNAMAAFEADLQANFRAAAVSVAALYKSSRRTSKRAYNAGYAAACQDLLLMIQQGVSAGDTNDPSGRGRTIERIMDYVEARLDAIKAREEEEEEDDEKEKERRPPASASAPRATTSAKPPVASPSVVRTASTAPLTPLTPPTFTSAPPRPVSPSPAAHTLSTPSTLPRPPRARILQLAPNPKEAVLAATPTAAFAFPAPPSLPLPPPAPSLGMSVDAHPSIPIPTPESASALAGTKRRHSAMAPEPPTPTPAPTSTSSRRRTRGMRSAGSGPSREPPLSPQDLNQGQGSDGMEVEEEGGRERKRVARR